MTVEEGWPTLLCWTVLIQPHRRGFEHEQPVQGHAKAFQSNLRFKSRHWVSHYKTVFFFLFFESLRDGPHNVFLKVLGIIKIFLIWFFLTNVRQVTSRACSSLNYVLGSGFSCDLLIMSSIHTKFGIILVG